jgi:hypothetical protein
VKIKWPKNWNNPSQVFGLVNIQIVEIYQSDIWVSTRLKLQPLILIPARSLNNIIYTLQKSVFKWNCFLPGIIVWQLVDEWVFLLSSTWIQNTVLQDHKNFKTFISKWMKNQILDFNGRTHRNQPTIGLTL